MKEIMNILAKYMVYDEADKCAEELAAQLAPDGEYWKKAIEVLDWLLEEKKLPTGIPNDFYEDKIIICDGTFYWESDKDGDHPMMGKDVMAIYNNLK